MTDESVLAKGQVERIGMTDAILTHRPTGGEKHSIVEPILEHTTAIKAVLEALTHAGHGVIKGVKEIDAVGHRVVHGGEQYSKSVIVTSAVKAAIEDNIELAPLHNPPNLKGIFVTNSRAYKVVDSLEDELVRKLKIVGFDLVKPNLKYLNEDKISFLINQNPVQQGYRGIISIVNHLVFKKVVERNQYLPLDIVVKENAPYYLKKEMEFQMVM